MSGALAPEANELSPLICATVHRPGDALLLLTVAADTQIAVIGGGISGLVCAWRMQQKGLRVRLLERGPRFGGVIDTLEQDGFLFDLGPQSFSADAPFLQLIDDLKLGDELMQADPRAPRYILHRGRLVPAPLAPPQLLSTSLFGWRTKLRLLTEPLRHTHPPAGDESMAAFMRRKFGEDLLTNLVAPFVSGVYAGDPERLSLPSSFPSVRQAEEQYCSVIRGQIKMRRKGTARPRLCNFQRGLIALTEALTSSLGASAECRAEITAIRRAAAADRTRFEIAYKAGGTQEALGASAIVIATPTREAATLLAFFEPRFVEPLGRIEYAPVVQVGLGYRLDQIASAVSQPLRGFGFLVPRTERLRILGTVWNSSLFPNRAPESTASFTSFLGGATDPGIYTWSDDRISQTVHTELSAVLGITGAPIVRHLARWERAIPQYNLGHGQTIAALNELCVATPGIFLAGNYLTGPSLPACVQQGSKIAETAAAFLKNQHHNHAESSY